jgi:uncharacterized protein
MSAHDGEIRRAISNRFLHLIVLPTEQCNFRCVYCYESFQLGKMPRDVVDAVKLHLTRRMPDLSSLQLSWFGGEPLLALDVIEDIGAHVASLLTPRTRFVSDITTNAYLLTPDVFARLCALDVRTYQISFDGTRDDHDRRRVLAGGGPTFDRIWANLSAMRSSTEQFSAVARLHLDRDNVAGVPRFVDEFAREFAGDARFRMFIRPISRLGGPNDKHLPVLDHAAAAEIAGRFAADCERAGVGSRVMERGDHVPVCYAAQLNSWVVRADGRLSKCTVALDRDANSVGRIAPDGSFTLDRGKLGPWARGLDSRDRGELGCPLQNFPPA